MELQSLLDEFFVIDTFDTREQYKVRHSFSEILLILVIGMTCGHNTIYDCLCFAEDNFDFFKNILPFDNGLPSKDTMYRVLSVIEPKNLDLLLTKWIKDIKDDIISIDGKTLRRSRFKTGTPVHTINACSEANGCIAQDSVRGKGHEREGVKNILENINIKGKLITTDALSTNDDIIKLILKKKGDYLLPVKQNRKTWYTDIKDYFDSFKKECEHYQRFDKNHGAIKEDYYISHDTSFLDKFAKIKTIGLYINKKNEKTYRYFISSKELDAKSFAHAVRMHWQVETMHQYLDITLLEDNAVICDKQVASNLSIIRKFILKHIKRYREEHNIKRSLDYVRMTSIKSLDMVFDIFKFD